MPAGLGAVKSWVPMSWTPLEPLGPLQRCPWSQSAPWPGTFTPGLLAQGDTAVVGHQEGLDLLVVTSLL